VLAVRRREAEDLQLAGRDVQQAGQHLQRGGLAGAVRAEQPDDLTTVDAERDLVDGQSGFVRTPYEALDRIAETGPLFVEGIGLGEIGRRDHWRLSRWNINGCVRHGRAPLSRVGSRSEGTASAQSAWAY
jgi:hypothetical protein